jgi:hypothetical protein
VITITDFELSFQFPIKREGASPVVAAGAADSVASMVVSGVAVASGVSVTAGTGAGASSPSLFDPEITNAPIRRIPTSTAKRTFDELWLLAADLGAGADLAAAGRGVAGAGVVETFTREEPVEEPIDGTGGITTWDAALLRAADFFTVFFFADVFFTADFLTTFFAAVFFTADFFFAAVFLAGDFFTAFLTADFLAVDFFAVDFFGAAFLAADFFFTATVISLS